MTQLTISQRQLDEYTTRLGQAEDTIIRLERENREKDAALMVAIELMTEVDGLLARYQAAVDESTRVAA